MFSDDGATPGYPFALRNDQDTLLWRLGNGGGDGAAASWWDGAGRDTGAGGYVRRGVELSDVAFETLAGPTSVLQSTVVASSAEASVASQPASLGQHVESGTSSGVVLWRNLGTSARQKCRASTEAIAPIKLSFTLASAGAVSCGHRGDLSSHTRNDPPTPTLLKKRPAR